MESRDEDRNGERTQGEVRRRVDETKRGNDDAFRRGMMESLPRVCELVRPILEDTEGAGEK